MMSEISPKQPQPNPEHKKPTKKELARTYGKKALHLYHNRPTTMDIIVFACTRAIPIILGGTVVVSTVDVAFDLDIAARMATIQTDPNAHPLVQVGQEFARTIGEESIPFEEYLEEKKKNIIKEYTND